MTNAAAVRRRTNVNANVSVNAVTIRCRASRAKSEHDLMLTDHDDHGHNHDHDHHHDNSGSGNIHGNDMNANHGKMEERMVYLELHEGYFDVHANANTNTTNNSNSRDLNHSVTSAISHDDENDNDNDTASITSAMSLWDNVHKNLYTNLNLSVHMHMQQLNWSLTKTSTVDSMTNGSYHGYNDDDNNDDNDDEYEYEYGGTRNRKNDRGNANGSRDNHGIGNGNGKERETVDRHPTHKTTTESSVLNMTSPTSTAMMIPHHGVGSEAEASKDGKDDHHNPKDGHDDNDPFHAHSYSHSNADYKSKSNSKSYSKSYSLNDISLSSASLSHDIEVEIDNENKHDNGNATTADGNGNTIGHGTNGVSNDTRVPSHTATGASAFQRSTGGIGFAKAGEGSGSTSESASQEAYYPKLSFRIVPQPPTRSCLSTTIATTRTDTLMPQPQTPIATSRPKRFQSSPGPSTSTTATTSTTTSTSGSAVGASAGAGPGSAGDMLLPTLHPKDAPTRNRNKHGNGHQEKSNTNGKGDNAGADSNVGMTTITGTNTVPDTNANTNNEMSTIIDRNYSSDNGSQMRQAQLSMLTENSTGTCSDAHHDDDDEDDNDNTHGVVGGKKNRSGSWNGSASPSWNTHDEGKDVSTVSSLTTPSPPPSSSSFQANRDLPKVHIPPTVSHMRRRHTSDGYAYPHVRYARRKNRSCTKQAVAAAFAIHKRRGNHDHVGRDEHGSGQEQRQEAESTMDRHHHPHLHAYQNPQQLQQQLQMPMMEMRPPHHPQSQLRSLSRSGSPALQTFDIPLSDILSVERDTLSHNPLPTSSPTSSRRKGGRRGGGHRHHSKNIGVIHIYYKTPCVDSKHACHHDNGNGNHKSTKQHTCCTSYVQLKPDTAHGRDLLLAFLRASKLRSESWVAEAGAAQQSFAYGYPSLPAALSGSLTSSVTPSIDPRYVIDFEITDRMDELRKQLQYDTHDGVDDSANTNAKEKSNVNVNAHDGNAARAAALDPSISSRPRSDHHHHHDGARSATCSDSSSSHSHHSSQETLQQLQERRCLGDKELSERTKKLLVGQGKGSGNGNEKGSRSGGGSNDSPSNFSGSSSTVADTDIDVDMQHFEDRAVKSRFANETFIERWMRRSTTFAHRLDEMCLCCHNDQNHLDTNNLYDHSHKATAGMYGGDPDQSHHSQIGGVGIGMGGGNHHNHLKNHRESVGSTAIDSVFDLQHDGYNYDRYDRDYGYGYGGSNSNSNNNKYHGYGYGNGHSRDQSDYDGSECTVESVLTDMELDYGDGGCITGDDDDDDKDGDDDGNGNVNIDGAGADNNRNSLSRVMQENDHLHGEPRSHAPIHVQAQ